MKKILKDKGLIISCVIVLVFAFITIGYAVFYRDLGLNGNISLSKVGKVRISNVELDTSKTDNTLDSSVLTVNDEGNLALNYSETVSRKEVTRKGTYLVYVVNESPFDYTYTGVSLNPEVNITNAAQDAGGATVDYSFDLSNSKNTLEVGDTIKPGETKVAAVIIEITLGSQNSNITIEVGGSGGVNSTMDNSGELYGTISTSSLDLSGGKEMECFEVQVINTYKYRRSFTLKSSNENFTLVDTSGNPISDFYIDPPSDLDSSQNNKTYSVCIKESEGSVFLSNQAKTSIVLSSNQLADATIGNLDITVDIYEEVDDSIPEIGNVSFSVDKYDQTDGSLIANVSWDRLDSGGTSITGYYILLYDATTGTLLNTYNQTSGITSYTITFDSTYLSNNKSDMVTNNHDYYVKVYGKDEAGNIGQSYCSLTDGNTYCVSSDSIKLKWEFDVITTGLSYMSLSSDSPTKAYINNTYSATLVPDTNYTLPSSITVTMGGEELVMNTDYTYSSASSGDFNITRKITGDISLTGTATSSGVCLVEGTKIKLADGTYKNIEDIKYEDLLSVYSYDLGKIVYEYPIYIEKQGTTDQYLRTTFSDGTILETVGSHGVFSKDLNKYVSVLDNQNFKVGTNIVKINENNEIEVIQVVKIETIKEKVNYYHVSSTRYHNILANDLLTTDPLLIISNMFPLNDNLIWTDERQKFLQQNDLFHLEDWTHLFPPHLFKGLRMEETKILYNKGVLDINLFYITLSQLIAPPVNENNNNIWMVTTSDDLLNKEKGNYYEEGSYYKLKEPINVEGKEFVGWYNTSNNKYYMPNDLVEVDYGMYFEAVWK